MALSDPIAVDLSGNAVSLPRVGVGLDRAVYRTEDGSVELQISHRKSPKGRNRHEVRFNFAKIEPDPLFPENNKPYTASVMLVVDSPVIGYSVAELKASVDGLIDFLTDSSGAATTKVLGGQS